MHSAAYRDLDFDGRRPVVTVLRLLRPSRGRVLLALLAFAVKDCPVWLLPLLTANIIDIVVEHRPIQLLWVNAAVLALVLIQNLPVAIVWTRLMSRITGGSAWTCVPPSPAGCNSCPSASTPAPAPRCCRRRSCGTWRTSR
ncbi:hypothetical protein J2S43_002655 [Catenuloplanes nepalensis]|uniref:ABC transmembrane type-1 domain-containing protein n=1 Tax=Catenuloplanes nepalensis TaxID=587533 RepID=A0ABT9MRX9_9ACTN|nr:hypothetical protein [Catenuloplanes nepalensis]MDP9794143.1 hypothetical protein [Catenuloplanes nepalensis]